MPQSQRTRKRAKAKGRLGKKINKIGIFACHSTFEGSFFAVIRLFWLRIGF
jgi:hypothetical protein